MFVIRDQALHSPASLWKNGESFENEIAPTLPHAEPRRTEQIVIYQLI